MSVEQDKRVQSLYASLKNVMDQNLSKDEQEHFLEWSHNLILDTAKERETQIINKKIKKLDCTMETEQKEREELIKRRNDIKHKNYPKDLKIGDIVSVNYGFGYCSEISNEHYGIIFSEYKAGLYLVLPLSSEPLRSYPLYIDGLNLPNKEGNKDKRSYIQLNHAGFVYYRRLSNVKNRPRINIGEKEILQLSNCLSDFLKLPVDKQDKQ